MTKRFLIFCLFFCFFTQLPAQNLPEHFIQYNPFTDFKKVLRLPDSTTLIIVQSLDIIKLDKEGLILWQKQLPIEQWSPELIAFDAMVYPNGDLAILVAWEACDLGGTPNLVRVSSTGDSIWSIDIPLPQFFLNQESPITLLPADNNAIVVSHMNERITIDANGSLLNQRTDDFHITGFTKIDTGFVTWAYNRVIKTTDNFVFVETYDLPEQIFKIIKTTDDHFLVLGDTKLYKTDLNFQIVAELGGLINPFPRQDIFEWNGAYWLTAKENPDNTGIVVRLNDNLSIHSKVIFAPKEYPLALLNQDQNLMVIGEEGGVFVKVIPTSLAGNIDVQNDAALTGVSFTRPATAGESKVCGWGISGRYFNFGPIYANITNNSPNTVLNEVRVNLSYQDCYVYCPYLSTYTKYFTNLNLQPGATVQVFLDSLNIRLLNTNLVATLCFDVSAPNNLMDAAPQNDQFCTTVTATVPTLSPPNLIDNIKVYPNPATSSVQIDLPNLEAPAKVWVFNSLGQEQQFLEMGSGQFSIERGRLNAGFYLLKIEQDGKLGYARVLFE
jgi:Secretion system C-terminal sorting domain